MTFLCVQDNEGAEGSGLRLLISNQYSLHKDRDDEGKVLPNQEWLHPDPTTLRSTAIGDLNAPEHVTRLMQTMVDPSVEFFGGHVRIISEHATEIAEGRLQGWEARQADDDARPEEMEAERQLEMEIERQKSSPIHECCPRSGGESEVCKSPLHPGMTCGGGVGDTRIRHCVNCLDLPYRELREKALGAPIEYAGEADEE